jgi:lipoprotein NlpI
MEARDTLGFANYFNADYHAAIEVWTKMLADQAARDRAYPAIWLYLASRRAGQDGAAAVKPFMPTQSSPQRPQHVLQWFVGAGSYDDALKVAKEDPSDPSRLCELYFYAGEKFLLDGDVAKARVYFNKSIGTGVSEFNEYGMAQRELARLGK